MKNLLALFICLQISLLAYPSCLLAESNHDFPMKETYGYKIATSDASLALSSKALVDYQLGDLEQAELELRSVIQDNPMFADARAALSALLWKKGYLGEAESHWAAVYGLDSRYMQRNWLLNVRHWPPEPANDLLTFIALRVSK